MSVQEFQDGYLEVDNPRLEACLDDGPPDIGTVWEVCLSYEFDRRAVVEGVVSWLGPPGGQRILDCACGSGLPALDLAALGYDVTCSDGSEVMLRHFRRNARLEGVALDAARIRWAALARHFAEEFDVVFCRGGAPLVYVATWDSGGQPDFGAVGDALCQMVRCLRPGGWLYVDMPRADGFAPAGTEVVRHPPLRVGRHTLELTERMTPDRLTGVRTWRNELVVDGAAHVFERRSAYVGHDDLVALMRQAGLADVGAEDVPGEPYDVFVGQRAPG